MITIFTYNFFSNKTKHIIINHSTITTGRLKYLKKAPSIGINFEFSTNINSHVKKIIERKLVRQI